MSNVNLLIHIVISTHHRQMSINTDHSADLYRYMTAIIHNHESKLIAINGIPNHIHLLIDLNQKIPLSSLVRDLKRSTSIWIKENGRFPLFDGWGEGYFAVSISYSHMQSVIDYIKSQREHHRNKHFEEEYSRLMLKNGLILTKYPDEQ